jgi:hypothetical protein
MRCRLLLLSFLASGTILSAAENYSDHTHLLVDWRAEGYTFATPTAAWRRECERRFGSAVAPQLAHGLHRAAQVVPLIVASSCFPAGAAANAECQSLGPSLAAYAKNTGPNPAQFESFAEAARRILAGSSSDPGLRGQPAKRAPDQVALDLDAMADGILAAVRQAESAIGPQRDRAFDTTITDLKILAHLARFHARRSIAAVHYHLFLRGQRLAELLAATYQSREVVAAWRELVAIARAGPTPDMASHWADELVKLEFDLKDLEAQCCPPEEATLKEKIWQPAKARARE